MNYKIFFISILLLVLSVAAVSAHDIDNNYVTESSDVDDSLAFTEVQDSNVLSASTGSFDNLQVEINNAPAGSVLNLTRDYNGAYGSRIQFNKDLTIDGQGHTLDCLKTECTAFYSSSGNIILKNLKIINGHNDDNYKGGAIHIEGSAQYTLINCTLSNNWADDYGGAIYNGVNKPLTIINCTFNNNEADDNNGGAIYSVGDVYLENSIFTSNFAYIQGGAVFCEKTVNIDKCLFKSNKVSSSSFYDASGGAVNSNEVNINNSTFEDNHAYHAGAVHAKNLNINVNQNKTQSFNTFFINNEAYNDGGAIISNYLNAQNAVFSKNFADMIGGAFSAKNADLTHCLFKSNKVSSSSFQDVSGGAIYCSNTVNIDNCTFEDNFAYDNGGAISGRYVNINVGQNPGQPYSTFFINNKADDDDGGAIYSYNGHVKAINAVFSGNSAERDGGAIYSKGDVYTDNCLFQSNKNGGDTEQCYGGAICMDKGYITNSIFKNNYAYDYGGAIYAKTLSLGQNCTFDSNTAYDNEGGAIWVNKFTEDVKYATFTNNKAGEDGGAIYINGENWITFSQCVFANNHCGDEGGAIYLDSSSSHLKLFTNIFCNNKADKEGQSVYNCGKFDSINNNWWGNNPSSGNDQLIEWKPWPLPNVHHVDSDPLKLLLKLSSSTCDVNSSVWATACFYYNNGKALLGEMPTECISFMPISDVEFDNRIDSSCFARILVSPQKAGQYTITSNLFGHVSSAVLSVSDSQEVVNLNSSASSNVSVDEDYDIGSDNGHISVNIANGGRLDVKFSVLNYISPMQLNLNPNLVDVNFDVNEDNLTNNNSTETPDNASVAKTIDSQSNGSNFNYFGILLVIVIVAGAGFLIKKYN